MENFTVEPGFWNYLNVFYLGTLGRSIMYMLTALIPYLIIWKLFSKKFAGNRIIKKEPASSQLWYEIRHSLQTMIIWGVLSLFHVYSIYNGYAQMYFEISDHSIGYYIFSIVAVIFIHDTYFYWTHRMMHHPKLFKHFHTTHHHSNNPTPWAIFSFQSTEAVVQFGITFILVFAFPLHYSVHIIWTAWLFAFNVLGHLGYEFYPKAYSKHEAFKWLNATTHHAMHHKYVTSNYGLYFTIWDRMMGTLNKKYYDTFDAIKSGDKI